MSVEQFNELQVNNLQSPLQLPSVGSQRQELYATF
jgi:hypothetical protein